MTLFRQKQGYLKNLKTVIKFKKNYELHFLIVYPRLKCSTKEIYSKVKKYNPPEKFPGKDFRIKSKFINFIKIKKMIYNQLLKKKHPIIKKLIFSIKK